MKRSYLELKEELLCSYVTIASSYLDFLREGGTEHKCLSFTSFRHGVLINNASDLRLKSHVQHAISLVQNKEPGKQPNAFKKRSKTFPLGLEIKWSNLYPDFNSNRFKFVLEILLFFQTIHILYASVIIWLEVMLVFQKKPQKGQILKCWVILEHEKKTTDITDVFTRAWNCT